MLWGACVPFHNEHLSAASRPVCGRVPSHWQGVLEFALGLGPLRHSLVCSRAVCRAVWRCHVMRMPALALGRTAEFLLTYGYSFTSWASHGSPRFVALIRWNMRTNDEGARRDGSLHTLALSGKISLITLVQVTKFGDDGRSVILDDGHVIPAAAVILVTGYESTWRSIFDSECVVLTLHLRLSGSGFSGGALSTHSRSPTPTYCPRPSSSLPRSPTPRALRLWLFQPHQWVRRRQCPWQGQARCLWPTTPPGSCASTVVGLTALASALAITPEAQCS